MKRSLLIGNGINAHLDVSALGVEDIRKRFFILFEKEKRIFEYLFGNKFVYNTIFEKLLKQKIHGIESLAREIYFSVRDGKKNRWTENEELRLQDVITCLALNAIFFDENGKINSSYNTNKLIDFGKYDYVFSLNYYEYWDTKYICKHLHGYFDLNVIPNDTRFLLSFERKMSTEYQEAIRSLPGKVYYADLSKVIFAPEGIHKSNLISVRGLYPSINLFPMNDLFFKQSIRLYKDLMGVKEIELFGVSPNGDDSLIRILNRMKYVKVYVYGMKSSYETKKWEELLTVKHEIVDSKEILLNT